MTNADHIHRNPGDLPAADRLERSHRIPLVATCVFVLTMLAIWLMGRQVSRHIVPDVEGDRVEWIRAD